MSSMLSAPASIPCTSDITLRPGRHAPGARESSHTDSFTNSSIPNRSASVAVTNSPASLTSRCSSNAPSPNQGSPAPPERPHRHAPYG